MINHNTSTQAKKCLSPMFCRIFHCLNVFSPQIPCACNITNKKGLFSYFETYKIEVLIIIIQFKQFSTEKNIKGKANVLLYEDLKNFEENKFVRISQELQKLKSPYYNKTVLDNHVPPKKTVKI